MKLSELKVVTAGEYALALERIAELKAALATGKVMFAKRGEYMDEYLGRIAELEEDCEELSDQANGVNAEYAALKKRYEELEARNAALESAQRWIPCSERLPDEGQLCVIASRYYGIRVDTFKKVFDTAFLRFWMPLPEPPQEKEV